MVNNAQCQLQPALLSPRICPGFPPGKVVHLESLYQFSCFPGCLRLSYSIKPGLKQEVFKSIGKSVCSACLRYIADKCPDFLGLFQEVIAGSIAMPSVGAERVVSMLRVVLLPAPLGPRNQIFHPPSLQGQCLSPPPLSSISYLYPMKRSCLDLMLLGWVQA